MNALLQALWQPLWYWFFRRRALASAPRGGICAEIGVWKGDFSQRLLTELRPRELHLVDPWRFAPDFPRRWYGGSVARSQADMDAIMNGVQQRFAQSPEVRLHRGTSVEIAAQFADGYFDWIYIDGDHSYQAVLQDLRAWTPKLRAGGSILLDDYYWRDEQGQRSVKSAIETFLGSVQVHSTSLIAGQFAIQLA